MVLIPFNVTTESSTPYLLEKVMSEGEEHVVSNNGKGHMNLIGQL